MSTPTTDRIEKTLFLRAARSKVWRALTTADEFGAWFGATFEGAFVPGGTVRGRITIPKYEHVTLEITIERVEPEHRFSFRWHPYAVDPNVDYSAEHKTLVEFTLTDATGGTTLTVVESGFDRLPIARRADAFRMNDGGWASQIKNIERYVTS